MQLFSPQPKNKKISYVPTTIEDKKKIIYYNSNEFKDYLKNFIKKEFEILSNKNNDNNYKNLNDELKEQKMKINNLIIDVNDIKMSIEDFSNKITIINNKLEEYNNKINNLDIKIDNFKKEPTKPKTNSNNENKKTGGGFLRLHTKNVILFSAGGDDNNLNDKKYPYVIYQKNDGNQFLKTKKLDIIQLDYNLKEEQMLLNQKYLKNNQTIFNKENDINNSILLMKDIIPSSDEKKNYSFEFSITLEDKKESNSSFVSGFIENSSNVNELNEKD